MIELQKISEIRALDEVKLVRVMALQSLFRTWMTRKEQIWRQKSRI